MAQQNRNPIAVHFLKQVEHHAGEQYMPNHTVLQKAQKLRVGSIEAISGAGKSHTLQNAIAYAAEHPEVPKIHIAKSSVTREMRDSERVGTPPYRRYFDLTRADHQEEVRRHLITRDLVQAEIHPTTGDIYMTEWEAYNPDAFNVIELMTDARQRVMRKGILPNLAQACLVPGDMQLWHQFFRERDSDMTDLEEYKRIKEGQISLRGSLANPAMRFVVNNYDNLAHIDVICAWTGQLSEQASQTGRVAAELALSHLDMMIATHPAREEYESKTSLATAAA